MRSRALPPQGGVLLQGFGEVEEKLPHLSMEKPGVWSMTDCKIVFTIIPLFAFAPYFRVMKDTGLGK